jgi:sugar phosphate isomerase/epimerase
VVDRAAYTGCPPNSGAPPGWDKDDKAEEVADACVGEAVGMERDEALAGVAHAVRIPEIPVGMSTAAVYPEPTAAAFALAAELGYDGVEVMVQTDPVSQSVDALSDLVQEYQIPVLSVHSPCLLLTARVWSSDPLVKLARSVDMAERLSATAVVVHPPFVWQRSAVATFTPSVAELQDRTDVRIAVENMFPVKVRGAVVNSYRPHWNPVAAGHRWFTLDLSHTATSRIDAMELAAQMGDRLGHLHLGDGSGSAKDEHLVPGRGGQPCAEMLDLLSRNGFDGAVVVEISTRNVAQEERETDLAEALTFARLHLAASV